MKNYRSSEKVNAGSMADIAFLLLIFFLVTTTIATDKGINRQLAKKCPDSIDCSKNINERNVLNIRLNEGQDIMIEDHIVSVSQIAEFVMLHIDNNGLRACNYCNGHSDPNFSDHPHNAFINIVHSRDTSYEVFVSVQDEISKAYNSLRNQYAEDKYGKTLLNTTPEELKDIQESYPIQISESTIN